MKLTRQELRLPAAQGIRVVALALLDDASESAIKLASSRGSDDLHDFRVAVRRFRSWTRAFNEHLTDVKRSDLRKIRASAAATNGGRDLEVHIEWLGKAGKGISRGRRRGAEWLVSQLGGSGDVAVDGMGAALSQKFTPARASLTTRLSSYSQPVRANGTSADTLAQAIGRRIVPHTDQLVDALDRVNSVSDEVSCHEARIMAKRLRYLLEPAAQHVRGGVTAIATLRALQESLGTLHDLHLMAHIIQGIFQESAASEAKRESALILGTVTGASASIELQAQPLGPGLPAGMPARPADLIAVAKRLRTDAEKSFKSVREKWLDGRHEKFSQQMAVVAERLMEFK